MRADVFAGVSAVSRAVSGKAIARRGSFGAPVEAAKAKGIDAAAARASYLEQRAAVKARN